MLQNFIEINSFYSLKLIIQQRKINSLFQKFKTEKIRSLFKSYLSQKQSSPEMIEKSVFQKRINLPTMKDISHYQNIKLNRNKLNPLNDISNYVKNNENPLNQIDYKVLYEIQLSKTSQLQEIIKQLEQKIKNLEIQNNINRQKQDVQVFQEKTSLNYIPFKKKSHKQLLFQEIKSFKSNLPNSMKIIQFQQLNDFQSVNFLTDEQITSTHDVNQLEKQEINENQLQKEQKGIIKSQKSLGNSAVTLKLINDESLIDSFAIFRVSQQQKISDIQEQIYYEGELSYCSKAPHQIVKHSAKLIYPQRIKKSETQVLRNQQAIERAVELISQTLKSDDFKAFTLIFQPATIPNDEQDEIFSFKQTKQQQILNIINKQRRFYAICLGFDDFDVISDNLSKNRFADISFENSIEEDIFKENIQQILQKQKKSQIRIQKNNNNQKNASEYVQEQKFYSIKITRKVLTIFTKYPFIPFFQSFLINCLKQSFVQRKQSMKKDLTQLKNFDHPKTVQFIKKFYSGLNEEYKLNKKFEGKINQIYEVKFMSQYLNRFQTISLELSRSLLKNYYSQMWAYSLLRILSLDNFLDIFTLMMLQQKIIFVCENQHILTSAIFLFTKVLIKPFNYPYPVVSIIPNEYDYFNAPFPIVYGCLNSKSNILKLKIPKIYKNVYIFITPTGVEIYSNRNLSKVLSDKSPKLRDKLMPSFIKMQQLEKQTQIEKPSYSKKLNGFGSFLGFNSSFNSTFQGLRKQNFNFSHSNRQLTHQIIQKVLFYMNGIKDKLPSRKQVNQIKEDIQKNRKLNINMKSPKTFDIEKQTYEKVKTIVSSKTVDPFIKRFLNTQIIGMEILG